MMIGERVVERSAGGRLRLLTLALIGAVSGGTAAEVTLAPGERLDWLADPPAAGAVVQASGGTVAFKGDATVGNVFELSGPVTADIASGAAVRFAGKWLRKTSDGVVTCTGPVTFGSASSSAFSYLPPESLAFTDAARAAGAAVTFRGYPSFTVLPGQWQNPVPYVYGDNVCVTLYGEDMFPVEDGRIALPAASSGSITWYASGSENFRAGVPVVVPAAATLALRRRTFNPKTGSGTSWTASYPQANPTATFTTDVELGGGTLFFDTSCKLVNYGSISGTGEIRVSGQSNVLRNLYGSLAGMTADSTLTLLSQTDKVKMGDNAMTRLNSSFPGAVVIKATSPTNITSIGFASPDSKYETNAVYRLGALTGEGQISGSGPYGPRLQYNARQKIVVGTLSGQLFVVASTVQPNSSDLEVENCADGTISIRNGLRLKIGAASGYPAVRYDATQSDTTNALTLADGVFINEIRLPGSDQTVYLHAGKDCAVGKVTGAGTLVVEQGTVRIGASVETAKVLVRGGAATFGAGQNLQSLLQKAALWLDASDTANMVGAWNAGWSTSTASGGGAQVLKTCPAVTFNGAPAATYTNGFPLIEKWYDRRPSQRLNYGWQDRCVNYSVTLYTLAYPYLVPNGLNGRAYMSFGEHGEADLDPDGYGLSDSIENANSRRERRRMPFMQDMKETAPEGHAISCKTIVMVFGSQQGGGRAIIGGYKGDNEEKPLTSANGRANWTKDGTNPACGTYFYRVGSGYGLTNAWLSSKDYPFFVDNEEVDPTKTAPNGGWQIVSVGARERAVRSLGMSKSFLSSGGQNYAEILLFTNELSTVERRTVEGYLALKWNLPNALSVKGPVEVADGATVKGHVVGVTGEGTWLIDSPEASPALDGAFGGDLVLAFAFANGAIADPKVLNSAATQATGVVTVDFAEPPSSGSYELLSGTAVDAIANWKLVTTGSTGAAVCGLVKKDGKLHLVAGSGGTLILFR